MENSTEELAQSQLEILYGLGILDRDSDDVQSSSKENTPVYQHDAFLAALPPPAAVFDMISKTFSDESEFTRRSNSDQSSDYYGESSDGDSSHSRHRQRSKSRRSVHATRIRSSEKASVLLLPESAKRDHRMLRLLFGQWRHFVRHRRLVTRRQVALNAFLKQKIITKWAIFLKKRRCEYEKKKLFDSWRKSRVISHWVRWNQRCRLLRALLDGTRRTFMQNLIQQRVWRRWIQFTKRRKYIHEVLTRRISCIHFKVLRDVWIVLRIRVFQARQARLALLRCFKRFHNFRSFRERQRLICSKYHTKMNLKRKHELLRRWRTFAYKSCQEKRLACRVQFDVRRRRYFLLWCEVARSAKLTMRLREKSLSRTLHKHFLAWNTITKAIQFGNQVRTKHEKCLRALYFKILKDQTRLSGLGNRVQLSLARRRQAIAVKNLRNWTRDRKRNREAIHRVQQKWQKRLLRCVWSEGWLKIYRKILASKHSSLVLQTRYFKAWKLLIRVQQLKYHQQERAEELYSKFCCQKALAVWKCYIIYRLNHAQQVVRAQEHHRKTLLRQGITCLWDTVYQNTQNSLRGHQLKHKSRVSLKNRHFCAWQLLARSRKTLADKVKYLQQRFGCQKSIFNPIWRKWNRWVIFVSMCQQRHRCELLFQLGSKRRLLLVWHRHVLFKSRMRAFSLKKGRKIVKTLFSSWKSRAEKWRKVSAICDLADRVFERKLCTQVIQEWHKWSTNFHRIRLWSEFLQQHFEAKLHAKWFSIWHKHFQYCQRLSSYRHNYKQRNLRECFSGWYKYTAQQKIFSRKLVHFQQVFGKFPALSIVSRVWHRWQQASKLSKHVKLLHRNHQLGQTGLCWSHWKIFHTSCQLFRQWRFTARTMSSGNNALGTRLRLFRESRRHQLKMLMIKKWKCLIQRVKKLQEKQSLWKHQLNCELVGESVKSQRADLFHSKIWFQKWYIGCNTSKSVSDDYFRVRLLKKILVAWWKKTIHSKQDKVLMEAQQVIGKLSYYHPQQQNYIAEAMMLKRQKKTLNATVKTMNNESRADSMRRRRRMLDPIKFASYAQTHQDSEMFSRSNPNIKPVVWSTDQHVNSPGVSASAPCSQKLGTSSRVHFADAKPRIHHPNVGHDEGDGARSCIKSTKETGHYKSVQEHDSHHSDKVRSAVFIKRLDKKNSNQLRPVRDHTESILHPLQHSHKNKLPVDLKTENVLPLFDKDIKCSDQKEKVFPLQRTTSAEYTTKVDLNNQQSSYTQQQNQIESPHIHYRKNVNIRERSFEVSGPRRATPVEPAGRFAPVSESNKSGRHGKSHVKTRHVAHKKRGRVVNLCSNESRPLSEILELNEIAGLIPAELKNDTTHPCNDNPVWDSSIIREILCFYTDSVLASANVENRMKVTRMSVCYRIARDFALLQNNFYIDELQKVCNASFQEKFIKLSRHTIDADKAEEQLKLEQFLETLVEKHPAYRKYQEMSLRQRSAIALSPFTWLAQRHLQPQILLQKRAKVRLRKTITFWVWEPMPIEMDLALDKLLPAIMKYMRVLGQFFLRQAVQRSSTTESAQDYRIDSTAFIALMKQVRVFPQLFHRRELENAVKLSACSSPDTEELNFPEFIETLVRCSSKLRWGEVSEGHDHHERKSDDAVVVIKFVMLIFAMEGQGSVLKQRNEDVRVILGFLGQQHKKKQAEKLYRFRKVLADNKRRAREARNQPPSSVWNHVRLHFSPEHSPTKSHQNINGLTDSWDGEASQQFPTEPFVFNATTNERFGLNSSSPPSPNAETFGHSRQECEGEEGFQVKFLGEIKDVGLNSPISAEEIPPMNVEKVLKSQCQATESSLTNAALSQQPAFSRVGGNYNEHETEGSELIRDSDGQVETRGFFVNAEDSTLTSVSDGEQESNVTGTRRASWLAEPMEKVDFLLEILNSIGDVEMLLSQSQVSSGDLSRQDNRIVRRTNSSLFDVSTEIPSLSDLAAGSAPYDHFGDRVVVSSKLSGNEGSSEIPVRDPMLNHLTDIDRFTESSETTSLLSIADMTGIPYGQGFASQHKQNDFNVDTYAQHEATSGPDTATQSTDNIKGMDIR